MISLFTFLIGSAIGSLLNVIAIRSNKNQDYISDRSECPNCKHKLSMFDTLPVIGYLINYGKCRYCQNKISLRYILVEIIGGLIAFSGERLFLFILLFISLNDVETMEVDIKYLLFMMVYKIIINRSFLLALTDGLIVSLPLLVFSLLTNSIGLADVELYYVLGVVLGKRLAIIHFVLSIIIGCLYAIYLILIKKQSRKTVIPFVPIMSVSYILIKMIRF